MPNVTVTQADVSEVVRQMANENAGLRIERAALSRTIVEMDAKITALEAQHACNGTAQEGGQVQRVNTRRNKGEGHDQGEGSGSGKPAQGR